jgi:outer membrane protein TolC
MDANAQDTLSLTKCIRVTLERNVNSTIYKNDVLLAQQKVRENKSAFLPTVSGNASFDYNIKLQTSIIPAGTLSPTETKLQIGNKFSTGGYLEADQAILDKSSGLAIRSAKVDKDISDLNVLKENESLIYNTASAYYQVLTYGEKGKLLRENENQYKQLLSILKLRYEQGVVKKSEYDRTRVNLNNIQAELALNENNYQLAINKLKNAMGIHLSTLININDSIDYSAQVAMPEAAGFNTRDLVSYRIDEQNILLKDIDVQKKKAAFVPTLSAYAKYGVNAYGSQLSNAFNNWFDYSAIGVKLTVPIFSGFKKSSQLEQSKLDARNQRLTARLNNDSYKLDYENSGSQLFSSYTSLLKNKENLSLAREVLQATGLEYKEGTSTLSTFLDDDYSYKEAQSNYITSLLDFLNSRLSFEKAKGTLTNYVSNLK